MIRGWSNYFRIAHDFSKAANTLDHQAFWIAAKTLCRKFDLTTAKCLRKYRFGSTIGIDESCTLMRAQDVKMVSHLHAPEPYRPGTGCYLEDLDWEVDFRLWESGRPGRMDTKVLALFRDGYRCRTCGTRVTYDNSEADHIEPVSRFASFQQANVPKNIQILCLACHKGQETLQAVEKHLESRMLGNLHVRFGVGAGAQLPRLHHPGRQRPGATRSSGAKKLAVNTPGVIETLARPPLWRIEVLS